jgi:hypothetical protein
MAKKLGMTDGQLSGHLRAHKAFGSGLARRIEKQLSLPSGWLDSEHRDLTEEGAAVGRWFQGLSPEEKQALRTLHKFPKK